MPLVQNRKASFFQQFADFLKTFGVIGLAIAFVIGQASSNLVTAMVDDLINPFIGLFLPAGSLSMMSFTLGSSKFMYGDFISSSINFLIIALVVFALYSQLRKSGLAGKK